MLKISDTLQNIIQSSPILQFGFSHKLYNLSQLSRFLKPLIESQVKREVQISAITMNLSRLQPKLACHIKREGLYHIEDISVRNNIGTITFDKTQKIQRQIQIFEQKTRNETHYFTITQSTSEITISCETKLLKDIKDSVEEAPKYFRDDLSALRVQFPKEMAHTPGLFFLLTQTLNLQGINIEEVSSTFTELVFFIKTVDIKLAFATLHDSFS